MGVIVSVVLLHPTGSETRSTMTNKGSVLLSIFPHVAHDLYFGAKSSITPFLCQRRIVREVVCQRWLFPSPLRSFAPIALRGLRGRSLRRVAPAGKPIGKGVSFAHRPSSAIGAGWLGGRGCGSGAPAGTWAGGQFDRLTTSGKERRSLAEEEVGGRQQKETPRLPLPHHML